MAKARSKAAYMISAVAEQYEIHPQTLRLYEREGLLKPSRSDGNTRLYTDDDLERLEVILKLTRDLGVNLAGVEIILNMREKMAEMQRQIEEFVSSLNTEITSRRLLGPAGTTLIRDKSERPKKEMRAEKKISRYPFWALSLKRKFPTQSRSFPSGWRPDMRNNRGAATLPRPSIKVSKLFS